MGPVGIRAVFAAWRELGYMPGISDRHAVENWPWFLANDTCELDFGIGRTDIAKRQRLRAQKRQTIEQYLEAEASDEAVSRGHGDDPVVSVIESLCGLRSFTWGSNYRNVGQIPGVPEGAVVETRCVFDGAGVHPFPSPMPDLVKALVLPHVFRQEAIIDIAMGGTFDELVALVATDPLCSRLPMGRARDMVREMVQVTGAYIPNEKLVP
jgi:alpha-galactosidase